MTQEEQQLKELRLRENAFTRHNFFELETVEQDRAVYRLDIRPESKNPYGMVHGGALYTMADDAAGAAVHTDGRHYVTQHGDLHFLKNQPSGTIRAEGRVRPPALPWWISPMRPGSCWPPASSPISALTRIDGRRKKNLSQNATFCSRSFYFFSAMV